MDAHVAGEPLRVILEGFPQPPGDTILERRRYLTRHWDHLRRALLWEPRGHRDMYGCLLTPAVTEGADFGVLFMHNAGYSTMCGHGIIGVAAVVLQVGLVPRREPQTELAIDTPAGSVRARARVEKGRVSSVSFENVPSFAVALDQSVEVPQLGRLSYDLAFGGAYYAYVEARQVGLRGLPSEIDALIDTGMRIKRAVARRKISHPFEEDLGFLYGTIFMAEAEGDEAGSRHVCIFAEGEVDRSPTGTGVSGRVAIEAARGRMGAGDSMVIESILGTRFRVSIASTTEFGPYPAVIPEVEGRAFLTGRAEWWIDPEDPLGHGFLVR